MNSIPRLVTKGMTGSSLPSPSAAYYSPGAHPQGGSDFWTNAPLASSGFGEASTGLQSLGWGISPTDSTASSGRSQSPTKANDGGDYMDQMNFGMPNRIGNAAHQLHQTFPNDRLPDYTQTQYHSSQHFDETIYSPSKNALQIGRKRALANEAVEGGFQYPLSAQGPPNIRDAIVKRGKINQ